MKKSFLGLSQNSAITLVIVILVGIVIAVLLFMIASGNNLAPVSDPECKYYGQTFQTGDRFQAGDGCNTCFCEDGIVSCTEISCNVPGLDDV